MWHEGLALYPLNQVWWVIETPDGDIYEEDVSGGAMTSA